MIDYAFFQDGLLMVEGAMALAAPSPTNEAIMNRIEWYIKRYESEYLCKLLGEELYNNFLAHREEEAWKEFEGMVADASAKISPIANYVYFFLVRDSHATATINGVKKDGDDNLVSPERKMVRAWNDMVEQNRRIYSWLCRTFHKVQTEQELLETINAFNV